MALQRLLTGSGLVVGTGAGLEVLFTGVLPGLTPLTQLGLAAVSAYAQRYGLSTEEYVAAGGEPPLTPAGAGAALLELASTDTADLAPGYLLTGTGLRPLT
jgi:hypothetical protein